MIWLSCMPSRLARSRRAFSVASSFVISDRLFVVFKNDRLASFVPAYSEPENAFGQSVSDMLQLVVTQPTKPLEFSKQL